MSSTQTETAGPSEQTGAESCDFHAELSGKHCLVTGAAGFIGSHLSRRLLEFDCQVTGIDCFTDYYDRQVKKSNVAPLLEKKGFKLFEMDLAELAERSITGVDIVFHQAAQAGVRASWGSEFSHYTRHNVLATQRLLEWARDKKLKRFVYASSSSVYGNTGKLPMHEDDLPRPLSPYGVSKLAAEHLCNLYYQNFALPAVSLRYFTVYGPAQRPDMAFHRFIKAIKQDEQIVIYGSGEQTRDFTYIDDIITANLSAALVPGASGRVYNIGGGSRISVNGVLDILGKMAEKPLRIKYEPVQAGDPPHTFADTMRAKSEIAFSPAVSLQSGLLKMYESFKL